MSTQVLLNTKRRFQNLHLYGGQVFEEALLDPIKTVKRDCLPRFLTSSLYKKMAARLKSLAIHRKPSSLLLKLPGKSPTTCWDDDIITVENIAKLSVIDMLHDRLMYSNFLTYCMSLYTHENLLCARAIAIFKCEFKGHSDCPPAADEATWVVFQYFAFRGSCYDASLSHRSRKAIKLNMAHPHINMFDRLERSVNMMIRAHWSTYCA